MAKKVKTDESGIVATAKAVGTAAGKIAALVGVTPDAPRTARVKTPKLTKKNKQRLPRRQKKAQQKQAAR